MMLLWFEVVLEQIALDPTPRMQTGSKGVDFGLRIWYNGTMNSHLGTQSNSSQYVCPVRGCGAAMQIRDTLLQDGTGDKAFVVVCDRRPDIHRGWVVEKVGKVLMASRGRWGWSKRFDV